MSIFSEHFEEEIINLNRLLDDSNLTTSALFQLLRDHNVHVGSTELIKAREKVEAEIQTLRTANAGLLEKLADRERELDEANKLNQRLMEEIDSARLQADLNWKMRKEFEEILGTDDVAIGVYIVQHMKRDAARYEVVRKMNATQFAEQDRRPQVKSKAVQMAAYVDMCDKRDRLQRELDGLTRERNRLREAVKELMGLLDGSAAQNALQRAKDLLP